MKRGRAAGQSRPRVLMLTTSYPLKPDSFEGFFVQELAEHLARRCPVTVLCPHAPGVAVDELRNGVRVRRFRYAPESWQRLAYGAGGVIQNLRVRRASFGLLPPFLAAMGVRLCREATACDVIHANWAFSGLLACLTRGLHRKPVVVTLRGSDVKLGRSRSSLRWAYGHTVRRATRLTAVSSMFGEGLDPSTFRFIPNGVSIPDSTGIREKPCQKLRFLVLGSLIPEKRVDLVIEALAALQGLGVDAQLELVGDGDERTALLAQAERLGVVSRVTFTGFLEHKNALRRLAVADCLVLASRWEGRPNVLLEAMAAGKPFVASDLPGCAELADRSRSGLLFRSEDGDDLTQKLAWIARNRDAAATMGRMGRTYVAEEGLTWARCAERYLEVFREALCAES